MIQIWTLLNLKSYTESHRESTESHRECYILILIGLMLISVVLCDPSVVLCVTKKSHSIVSQYSFNCHSVVKKMTRAAQMTTNDARRANDN
jgi:hypothetical protein